MKQRIREIASRIKEVRNSKSMTIEQVAKDLKITKYEYEDYEAGEHDIPISFLFELSHYFGIDINVLLTGQEPTKNTYDVTRKGSGVSVERQAQYKYQALANDFKNKHIEPFVITVDSADEQVKLSKHDGHEFLFVIEGNLQIYIGEEIIKLTEGDSIYYDSKIQHAVTTDVNKRAKCLAILI
ncbi:MAG: helix-turn-helix domain-containing protein [Bacteroidales bacterium]|nr:helix-turn-helix domain-containing protein [Bacteroidales bacterium]